MSSRSLSTAQLKSCWCFIGHRGAGTILWVSLLLPTLMLMLLNIFVFENWSDKKVSYKGVLIADIDISNYILGVKEEK